MTSDNDDTDNNLISCTISVKAVFDEIGALEAITKDLNNEGFFSVIPIGTAHMFLGLREGQYKQVQEICKKHGGTISRGQPSLDEITSRKPN